MKRSQFDRLQKLIPLLLAFFLAATTLLYSANEPPRFFNKSGNDSIWILEYWTNLRTPEENIARLTKPIEEILRASGLGKNIASLTGTQTATIIWNSPKSITPTLRIDLETKLSLLKGSANALNFAHLILERPMLSLASELGINEQTIVNQPTTLFESISMALLAQRNSEDLAIARLQADLTLKTTVDLISPDRLETTLRALENLPGVQSAYAFDATMAAKKVSYDTSFILRHEVTPANLFSQIKQAVTPSQAQPRNGEGFLHFSEVQPSKIDSLTLLNRKGIQIPLQAIAAITSEFVVFPHFVSGALSNILPHQFTLPSAQKPQLGFALFLEDNASREEMLHRVRETLHTNKIEMVREVSSASGTSRTTTGLTRSIPLLLVGLACLLLLRRQATPPLFSILLSTSLFSSLSFLCGIQPSPSALFFVIGATGLAALLLQLDHNPDIRWKILVGICSAMVPCIMLIHLLPEDMSQTARTFVLAWPAIVLGLITTKTTQAVEPLQQLPQRLVLGRRAIAAILLITTLAGFSLTDEIASKKLHSQNKFIPTMVGITPIQAAIQKNALIQTHRSDTTNLQVVGPVTKPRYTLQLHRNNTVDSTNQLALSLFESLTHTGFVGIIPSKSTAPSLLFIEETTFSTHPKRQTLSPLIKQSKAPKFAQLFRLNHAEGFLITFRTALGHNFLATILTNRGLALSICGGYVFLFGILFFRSFQRALVTTITYIFSTLIAFFVGRGAELLLSEGDRKPATESFVIGLMLAFLFTMLWAYLLKHSDRKREANLNLHIAFSAPLQAATQILQIVPPIAALCAFMSTVFHAPSLAFTLAVCTILTLGLLFPAWMLGLIDLSEWRHRKMLQFLLHSSRERGTNHDHHQSSSTETRRD